MFLVLAKQLYSFSLSAGFFSHLLLLKASIKCVKLIWQLTHDGGTPAFVACDGLDRLPHIFGVEISAQSPDVSAIPL